MTASFVDLQGLWGKITISFGNITHPSLTLCIEEEGKKPVEVTFNAQQLSRIRSLELYLENEHGQDRHLQLIPQRSEETGQITGSIDVELTNPPEKRNSVLMHSYTIYGHVATASLEHFPRGSWQETEHEMSVGKKSNTPPAR